MNELARHLGIIRHYRGTAEMVQEVTVTLSIYAGDEISRTTELAYNRLCQSGLDQNPRVLKEFDYIMAGYVFRVEHELHHADNQIRAMLAQTALRYLALGG